MELRDFYYEQDNNRKLMILDIKNERDIDNLGLGMLNNNDIKGLVKLTKLHINTKYQFRYDITSYEKLSDILENEIKWSRFISILKGIVKALLESENYLLESEKVIINSEYIFFDKNNKKVQLIYIPLNSYDKKFACLYSFIEKILNTIVFQDEDCNSNLGRLFNYLNKKEDKSLDDFLILLDNITTRKLKIKSNTMENRLIRENKQVESPLNYKKLINWKFFKKKNKEEKIVLENPKMKIKSIGGHGLKIPGLEEEIIIKKEKKIKKKKNSIINKKKYGYLISKKSGEASEINKKLFKIGNDKNKCNLTCLNNTTISREHAEIFIIDEEFFLLDNNSTNKTYINNVELKCNIKYKLNNNDKLKFSNEIFYFEIR